MSQRSPDDWLGDIVLWGTRLKTHLSDADWNAFLQNPLLQDAASKCIEAIGEAAGRLDRDYPDLSHRFFADQLKQARRSRDRLAHGYYHIDLAILWQTAIDSIPRLVDAARAAKERLRDER